MALDFMLQSPFSGHKTALPGCGGSFFQGFRLAFNGLPRCDPGLSRQGAGYSDTETETEMLPRAVQCTLACTFQLRVVHMRETTFTDLRNQAKRYFDLVEAGEIVRVLRNGKPIAEIHPIAADLPSWKQRQARPLAIGGEEISRMILEERGH